MNVKAEFPSDSLPNAPFKIIKGEDTITLNRQEEEYELLNSYNSAERPSGQYKKDYLEDLSIITKPTIQDSHFSGDGIDPILMGQGAIGQEFIEGYFKNVNGLKVNPNTPFGFPRFKEEDDKFQIPTTNLFKEL